MESGSTNDARQPPKKDRNRKGKKQQQRDVRNIDQSTSGNCLQSLDKAGEKTSKRKQGRNRDHKQNQAATSALAKTMDDFCSEEKIVVKSSFQILKRITGPPSPVEGIANDTITSETTTDDTGPKAACSIKPTITTQQEQSNAVVFLQPRDITELGLLSSISLECGVHSFGQFTVRVLKQIEKVDRIGYVCISIRQQLPAVLDKNKVIREAQCQEILFNINCTRATIFNGIASCMKRMIRFINAKVENGTREFVQSETLPFFEEQCIVTLAKRKSRFPSAVYFCQICDYHINSLTHAKDHIARTEHHRAKMEEDMREAQLLIPPPCLSQCEAIGCFIYNKGCDVKLSDNVKVAVSKVEKELTLFVQTHVHAECYIRLYGSMLSGFATKSHSNVNFELIYPHSHLNHATALTGAYEALRKCTISDEFVDVIADFSAKAPAVYFHARSLPDLDFILSVNNSLAFNIASLLKIFTDASEAIAILGTTLRQWSYLCGFCEYENGGFAKYFTDLLLIHFLQHQGIIPPVCDLLSKNSCSWAMLESGDFSRLIDCCQVQPIGQAKLGLIWINFFRWYAVERDNHNLVVNVRLNEPLTREDKKWHKKRIAAEDPFMRGKNIGNCNPHMFDFFFSCLQCTYRSFAIPRAKSGEFLLDVKEIVSKSMAYDSDKEDEFSMDNTVSDLLNELLNHVCQYSPRHDKTIDSSECDLGDDVTKQSDPCQTISESDAIDELEDDTPVQRVSSSSISQDDQIPKDESTSVNSEKVTKESENKPRSMDLRRRLPARVIRALKKEALKMQQLASVMAPADFMVEFNKLSFCLTESPLLTCVVCQEKGHTKLNCPEEQLPICQPLRPQIQYHHDVMNLFLWDIKNVLSLDNRRINFQTSFCAEVEFLIQEEWPMAKISLFGSSVNGLGFQESDLDMCMTFNNHSSLPEGVDPLAVVKKIARIMRGQPRSFQYVMPILSAKVPIVKFVHVHSNLQGDISLYNTLALRNTRMLRTYVDIEPRLQVLGYVVKIFAKTCNIGDASRGSLSSYAYVIMLIYYLQQKGLLPVLQKLKPSTPKCVPRGDDIAQPDLIDPDNPPDDYIVDGWNTYFLDHLPDIKRTMGQTDPSSVFELWIDFLDFYAQRFRFGNRARADKELDDLLNTPDDPSTNEILSSVGNMSISSGDQTKHHQSHPKVLPSFLQQVSAGQQQRHSQTSSTNQTRNRRGSNNDNEFVFGNNDHEFPVLHSENVTMINDHFVQDSNVHNHSITNRHQMEIIERNERIENKYRMRGGRNDEFVNSVHSSSHNNTTGFSSPVHSINSYMIPSPSGLYHNHHHHDQAYSEQLHSNAMHHYLHRMPMQPPPGLPAAQQQWISQSQMLYQQQQQHQQQQQQQQQPTYGRFIQPPDQRQFY